MHVQAVRLSDWCVACQRGAGRRRERLYADQRRGPLHHRDAGHKPLFEKRHHSSMFCDAYDTYEWLFEQPKTNIARGASYRDHKPCNEKELSDKAYNFAIKEFTDLVDGKLRSHRFIEHNGIRGLDIHIDRQRDQLLQHMRIFVVGRHQYTIQYAGLHGSEESANVEVFMNSFRVHR